MPSSSAACTTSRLPAMSSFMPRLFVPSPTTDTTSPELPNRRKSMSSDRTRRKIGLSGQDPLRQRGENVLHPLLGVAEQHGGVLAEEQRVLHARVPGRHRPLEHDDAFGVPD